MSQRIRISTEMKERIVDAFEDPSEDYLAVADELKVNRSTARGVVARYLREGRVQELPRGGRNNTKVDEEMKQCLNEILDVNYTLTIKDINSTLRARLPNKPLVHDRTIARTLDGMLVSHAKPMPIPDRNILADIVQSRFEYATWFVNDGIVSHCVFIDECTYDIWTSRSYGRAANGVGKAYRQVCGQRGRNVIITMAISARLGLVHHTAELVRGINNHRFNEFLEQTRQRLSADDKVVFVYDNTPAYRNVQQVDNAELKTLPPYSSFLNVIDLANSCLKEAIGAYLSRPDQQDLMGDRDEATREGLPLGEFRKTLLLRAVIQNMNEITPEKCMRWYNHMQTYLQRCLNKEDINGAIKNE